MFVHSDYNAPAPTSFFPFYLPSPEQTPLFETVNPLGTPISFVQAPESTSELTLPSPSCNGTTWLSDEQYAPLSSAYCDLVALVHVAFIVAVGADDGPALSLHLLPANIQPADIAPESIEWRLLWSQMAVNLVLHLLDVAESSSLGLPAFGPLLAKLPQYRSEIHNLSPDNKIAVTILCTLGARATSHFELIGVAATYREDLSPHLTSTVGCRRDEVCQSLLELTLDLCDDHSVSIGACTLENLAALVQLFTVEEDWGQSPNEVLHLAHSLYLERLYACTTTADEDSLKHQAGLALFEYDCISSSIFNRACEITRPADYLPSHFLLPSLSSPLSLPSIPDPPHSHPLSMTDLSHCFLSVSASGTQRFFAELASLPRTSVDPSPILNFVPALWTQIDHVRTHLQRRQRAVARLEGEVETQVLLGITTDLRLVELLMVVHGFLLGSAGGSEEKWALVELSELRMRKCLKLVSFYASVYASSTKGRPLLSRLFLQLELLPNWTSLALQRLVPGAQAEEYEVSELELDWLTTAACEAQFFTSLASPRYNDLLRGRLPLQQPYIFIHLDSTHSSLPPSPLTQPHSSPSTLLQTSPFVLQSVLHQPVARFSHSDVAHQPMVALADPGIVYDWVPARDYGGVEKEQVVQVVY